MKAVGFLIYLKIATLLGAIAQTVGFIGLFFFEALDPWKWHLLIGGTAVVIVSEGLAYLLSSRVAAGSAKE